MTAIKGIGKKKAAAILEYIQSSGKVDSIGELKKVKGVGKKMLETLTCNFYAEAEGPLPCKEEVLGPVSGKVNINTAPEKRLMTLPGIGKKKAQMICEDRHTNGYFKSVQDLSRLKGIGPKIIAKLEPHAEALLNINTAHSGDFEALGFGDGKAIENAREKSGGFRSLEELKAVPGVDPKLVESLSDILTTEPAQNH